MGPDLWTRLTGGRREPPADGPASYLTLEPGTPVVDRFGAAVGAVERVLTLNGPGFDGLVLDTPRGKRFVDAPEVRRIDCDEVALAITCADVEDPGAPRSHGVIAARHGRTDVTDADRQETVDALKRAYVDDRLTATELGDRIEAAYEVTSLEGLEALVP
ncbi:MAG: hypothetical protein JWM73_21 [Solirubrobacterales bacterium]|nr:hypothetical protein [Solirubrobacterales bacterium]